MVWFRSVTRLKASPVNASRSGTVSRRLRNDNSWLGCLLFVLVSTSIVAGVTTQHPSLASIELPSQAVSFATKDGLLTATFSENTDDAALNAAIPALVAKGVQAVSL